MAGRERLAASVADIRARAQRLLELNRELLTSEMKEKGKKAGGAAALFAGAGLFALYAVGFGLATIAVALALVLPLWLSLLIVTAALFLVVAILALVGRSLARQAQKPGPAVARAEAAKTAELVRTNLRVTVDGVRAKLTGSSSGPEASEP
jgi:membrane protein implicated in regulation of membrane protease activity